MTPYFRILFPFLLIVLFLVIGKAFAQQRHLGMGLQSNDPSLVECFVARHPWGTAMNGTPDYRVALFCKDIEGKIYPVIIFHDDKDRI